MELPDHDLLAGAMRGDEDCWTALYRRHHGAVYRFALQMSGASSVAEEATQETFVVVLESGARFDAGRASFRTWLLGVARNKTLRLLKTRRAFEPIAEPAGEETLWMDLSRARTREMVRQAVIALPVPFREAVVLCDLEELSYEEAAAVLGCPVGTVRSRLSRGRRLLLDRLAPVEKGKGCLI